MKTSFFDRTNPATKLLTAVCNLLMVNLIFIITCLPIITIGASLCGLYKVLFGILNNDEVAIIKDYFKEFKRCFLKATAVWIPMVVVLTFFAIELYWILSGMVGNVPFLVVPIVLVAVIIISVAIYYFPLLSVFDNTAKETIRNAFLLSVGNMPTTIMVFMIHFVIAAVLFRGDPIAVVLLSLMLFIGFALTGLVCAFFLRRTIPASTKIEYDDDEDEESYPDPRTRNLRPFVPDDDEDTDGEGNEDESDDEDADVDEEK